jgi:hypothetical protein
MKLFRVSAQVTLTCYKNIQANDADDAYEKAFELDGDDWLNGFVEDERIEVETYAEEANPPRPRKRAK